MPGDRGTLTRRGQPAQDSGPRRPTAPGRRRPPQVARERKPALAALALLLIVGGALGAAYPVLQNAHRVAAIEVTQQLGAGEQIPAGALQEVQIAVSGGVAYVPWSEAGQVSRFYAATAIPPGSLLTSSMVARVNGLANGKSVVGLALKDGQLPDGLQPGDHVDLYQVSDASQSCPGTPGSLLASNAVVLGISAPPAAASASAVDVRVALAPSAAGAVTCNAANSNVAVAVLPGSVTGGAG
jgi:hypothetical protein